MVTVGFEKQKVWKLNMILILILTRIENVQWHEFKWGFKYKVSKHLLEDFIKWNFTWCIWKYNVKIKLSVRSRSLKLLIEILHVFLNTSIECLCAVRENLDRASNSIKLFKTLTKKIFEFPYSCVHMNMDTQKFI